MKRANTVEYPKEEKHYVTPINANEFAKISQGNSARMLIENGEPGLMINRQGSNPNGK